MIHHEFAALTGDLHDLNTVKLFLKTSTSRIQEVLAKKSSTIYSSTLDSSRHSLHDFQKESMT